MCLTHLHTATCRVGAIGVTFSELVVCNEFNPQDSETVFDRQSIVGLLVPTKSWFSGFAEHGYAATFRPQVTLGENATLTRNPGVVWLN